MSNTFSVKIVKNIGIKSKCTFGEAGSIIDVVDGGWCDLGGYIWDFDSFEDMKDNLMEGDCYDTEIELIEKPKENNPFIVNKPVFDESKLIVGRPIKLKGNFHFFDLEEVYGIIKGCSDYVLYIVTLDSDPSIVTERAISIDMILSGTIEIIQVYE